VMSISFREVKNLINMDSYLESTAKQLFYYKTLGEKAMDQLTEEQLFWQYNEESNSIAIIVQHIAGNMLSRFTDFLTTDGEKPWRNRDSEFVNRFSTREELYNYWNKGWNCLFDAISSLAHDDLERVVYIRHERHTVVKALNRQLAHYPYHVGQIVFIAKMLKNTSWKTLSVARNKSEQFNEAKLTEMQNDRDHSYN
jgi:hypothetical protein